MPAIVSNNRPSSLGGPGFRRVVAVLLLFAGLFGLAPVAQAKRVALVIGNARYAPFRALLNPARDASDVARTLKDLGFDVTLRTDLREADTAPTLRAFYDRIAPGDEVLFYYAGHGLQYGGENFLPATDLREVTREAVARASIRVNGLLEAIDQRRPAVTLVFLDACRNSPETETRTLSIESSRMPDPSGGGLAEIKPTSGAILIQFSTAPGATALDGAPGDRNGLYTKHLLRHLKDPSPIDRMLKDVAWGVREESERLNGGHDAQAPWKHDSLPQDFWFNREAQRLAGARQATALESAVFRTEPGSEFDACPRGCPRMKVLPPLPATDGSDRPVRLAVGITEVTFEQWDACIAAGRCPAGTAPDDGEGRGKRPATSVSREDVATYLLWLNETTGRQYRLPTDAEWEYAARGGRNTAYPWGPSATGGANANCKGCGAPLDWEGRATMPVGAFRANGYGLFDVIGNAEEWVETCPPATACNTARVRGGSFKTQARDATSSFGRDVNPAAVSPAIGFRVVLTL